MKKILIEVVCAATAKSYEFLLPAQMSVGVARKKIIEQIIACLLYTSPSPRD